MRGGTEILGRDCAILCLGTGANCAVFNREGEEHIFHYYLKDIHQGAGAIGSFIFQAVFDAHAGLAGETALTRLLLQETGYFSVNELFMMITTGRTENEEPWHYPLYQEYCPLLFRAIAEGDKVAADYLDWLCEGLVEYLVVGVKKLSVGERELDVVLSGGVPKGGGIMGERLCYYLGRRLPNARFVEARLEPVVGALLLGYDKLYPAGVPGDVVRTMEECCAARGLFRK
jgi:N-acetylglucosamine kinase-like BadF-type ATPase